MVKDGDADFCSTSSGGRSFLQQKDLKLENINKAAHLRGFCFWILSEIPQAATFGLSTRGNAHAKWGNEASHCPIRITPEPRSSAASNVDEQRNDALRKYMQRQYICVTRLTRRCHVTPGRTNPSAPPLRSLTSALG